MLGSSQLNSSPSPPVELESSSSSSSSDVFPDSTSVSSVDIDPKPALKPSLPTPFYPVSLSRHGNTKSLPDSLPLPKVPAEAPWALIDPQDQGTPDSWIPRDPRLVRLTGKHPFNCEAKLKDLYAAGFLTPSNLFYVRNHGAVPRVDFDKARDWKLEVHGLCANPTVFSLNDLCSKFNVVTLPITLVCAGNRRKEQNVIQKSLGFSWGAAGLSTAIFTGVYLADVLAEVHPKRSAKHVIFEGCDQLPNGPYGTSQLYSWAGDRRKGMLLCWAMNGLPLEPDHGFPLRLVVPGQIGGRSVKWLTRIELSANESQHHLHFHDNKVLPTSLGPGQARKELKWWYDPRYIINDLNVNSAIAVPNHDDIVQIPAEGSPQEYVISGYAYAGGGRRVTRVEVSLDDGATWSLADITYPEDTFRSVVHSDRSYGRLDMTEIDTSFCWCFWSFKVDLHDLARRDIICVRCMDESLALQQRDMYWNATGMMNNWWFRVMIHRLEGGRVRFEHPTMAGTQEGGWMQRLKDQGLDPLKPGFIRDIPASKPLSGTKQEREVMTSPSVSRKITVEEMQSHQKSQPDRPWFVVKGEVYDGTDFLEAHPGGSSSITLVAGEDATEDFMAIHSSDARKKLADFHIGTLVGSLTVSPTTQLETDVFLNPKQWKKVVLTGVRDVSKDSKVFTFAMDHPGQSLGLPTGQHVYCRLRRKSLTEPMLEGELVQRAYTPLSRSSDQGTFELLIKIYYPNAANPNGGRMSLGFSQLSVGDSLELKGPLGHFIWKGEGRISVDGTERSILEVGMVCGGSGITPILQVLRGILCEEGPARQLRVWVIDVNRDYDDILCREELDALSAQHPGRFHLHYTLTGKDVPQDWRYGRGRVGLQMLMDHLPRPSSEGIVCICGPPLMEKGVQASLVGLGWDAKTQLIIF